MKPKPYSFCLQSPLLSALPAGISCFNPPEAPAGKEHLLPDVSTQVFFWLELFCFQGK